MINAELIELVARAYDHYLQHHTLTPDRLLVSRTKPIAVFSGIEGYFRFNLPDSSKSTQRAIKVIEKACHEGGSVNLRRPRLDDL